MTNEPNDNPEQKSNNSSLDSEESLKGKRYDTLNELFNKLFVEMESDKDLDFIHHIVGLMWVDIVTNSFNKKLSEDKITYVNDIQTGERKVYIWDNELCYMRITRSAPDRSLKWELVPIDANNQVVSIC
jgi:hypothetical protein